MQRHSIKQVEAVTGSTPQELANNYNEAMRRLQGCHPTDEWHGDVVYIYYFCDETITECLTDEHDLLGDRHKCGECPFCTKELNRHGEVDVRFKWAVCGKTGEPTRVDSPACDIYYSMGQIRDPKHINLNEMKSQRNIQQVKKYNKNPSVQNKQTETNKKRSGRNREST